MVAKALVGRSREDLIPEIDEAVVGKARREVISTGATAMVDEAIRRGVEGLKAVNAPSSRAIGVNITLVCSVPQVLPAAKAGAIDHMGVGATGEVVRVLGGEAPPHPITWRAWED